MKESYIIAETLATTFGRHERLLRAHQNDNKLREK